MKKAKLCELCIAHEKLSPSGQCPVCIVVGEKERFRAALIERWKQDWQDLPAKYDHISEEEYLKAQYEKLWEPR